MIRMTNSSGFDETYLTPQEAADLLKVDRNTIYRWIKNETLEAIKVGSVVRIKYSSIPTYARKENK